MEQQKFRYHLVLEYALVIAVLAGIAWTAWFFSEYRYLPQPWFYEPSGTFMDWYSLSLWGQIPGAYDAEQTIYPPLSFVIMWVFSSPSCYVNYVSETVRNCDPWGIVFLSGTLAANVVLTFLALRKHDRATYIPRAIALSFGFPMLYAFERGNLVLLCYTAMLLAFGPLIKSARLRWFFAGVAVNLKVYLVGVLVAPLLRHRWLKTEGMLLFAVVIYLVSWQVLGAGSPLELYRNLVSFSQGYVAAGVLDVWFPSSLAPAISLLKGETFPITNVLGTDTIRLLLISFTACMRITQLLIVLAAIAIWLRPQVAPSHRPIYFAVALAIGSTEAGGYTQILLLLFVFMERWRGIGRPIAITIAYGLCIAGEYVIAPAGPMVRSSWLAGDTKVIVQYGVGLSPFLRTIGLYAISISLACVTIRDVWVDLRANRAARAPRQREETPSPPLPPDMPERA